MINFTDITKAVKEVLDEYNTSNKPYVITRNQRQNQDKNIASQGWIGIYRNKVEYEPHSTGFRYQTTVEIRLEVQVADFQSPEGCEERLEELIEFIMNACTQESNIREPFKGYVQHITGFDIDYDDNYAEVSSVHYQFATIIISCEVI